MFSVKRSSKFFVHSANTEEKSIEFFFIRFIFNTEIHVKKLAFYIFQERYRF